MPKQNSGAIDFKIICNAKTQCDSIALYAQCVGIDLLNNKIDKQKAIKSLENLIKKTQTLIKDIESI
jgi:hypothetical protein